MIRANWRRLFTAPCWSRDVPQVTPLGVSGLVPADSSSSLGSGVVATHHFTARHVDDGVSASLRLSGVDDDLVLPHVCKNPSPSSIKFAALRRSRQPECADFPRRLFARPARDLAPARTYHRQAVAI